MFTIHLTLLAVAGLLSSFTAPAPPPTAVTPLPPAPPIDRVPLTQAPSPADRETRFIVQEVVSGLEVPWDLAWDHTGRMLITERPGRLRAVVEGRLVEEPLYTVPDIKTGRGEIGLMGLCLHPDFATNGYIYIAHGYRAPDGSREDVRVVRLVEQPVGSGRVRFDRVIVTITPAGINHAGCALRFAPPPPLGDRKLYITTGEGFQAPLSQDMTSLAGKTLRLNDDGTVPDDNPFVGPEHRAAGVRPEIFSFGHRNAQGLDWQPGTGLMFQAEHGPSGERGWRGDDEVNIVEAGKNYGWPTIKGTESREGLVTPVLVWRTAIAPVAAVFYNAEAFPDWKGDLFVAALGGLRPNPDPGLYRLTIRGRAVVAQERLASTYGRLRAVNVGPDGYIYFTTSNRDGRARPRAGDDRVLRLVPKPAAQ